MPLFVHEYWISGWEGFTRREERDSAASLPTPARRCFLVRVRPCPRPTVLLTARAVALPTDSSGRGILCAWLLVRVRDDDGCSSTPCVRQHPCLIASGPVHLRGTVRYGWDEGAVSGKTWRQHERDRQSRFLWSHSLVCVILLSSFVRVDGIQWSTSRRVHSAFSR